MIRPSSPPAGPRRGRLTELTLLCWEEWQRRDWDTMAPRMDPAIVMDDVPEGVRYRGPRTVRDRLERFVASFPDGQIEVRGIHEAADTTTSELSFLGTNTGPIDGGPPTGRFASARFCEVFTFKDDRIVHVTTYYDRLGMLQQLRLAPSLGNAADTFGIRALFEAFVAEMGGRLARLHR